ncbi:MAG: hypothetical protein ACTSRS_14325 [Candidatus Helarchaeota archaeon]
MEPAEPLPVKPTFTEGDYLLMHHSMMTPANYNFSVLRNPTQNFKYRGILWLTSKNLVFKGFPVLKMGAIKSSEKLFRPFCEIDTTQPYEIKISLEKITEIFIGHDSTFQKRFQRYPKLKITFQENGSNMSLYFYLTRENLIDDELYINKRCSEWQNKIRELKEKERKVSEPTPVIQGVSKPQSISPRVPSSPATVVPSPPKPTPVGTDKLLQKAAEEIGAKRYGKVIVKPLEEREKPSFSTIATPIKTEPEKAEPEFTKLLDTLIPVSDEEFTTAAADSSIAKCPHCGWILGYATKKCPRCRKPL